MMSSRFTRAVAALLMLGALSASATASDFYARRNLVTNTAARPAEHLDPNLQNAWGIAFNPYGFVWVANNHSGVSTLYDGNGVPQSLVVRIPAAPASGQQAGVPTGIVFYGGNAFTVTRGATSAPARFIFATEDGTLAAWAPQVDPTNAIQIRVMPGAIYKGLAISGNGGTNLLYATDFFHGRVDVFDSHFNPVALPGMPFTDQEIPAGFAPFGIQAINGDLYVTYAKQDADKEDDVAGRGLGYVDVYSPQGQLLRRFASRGALNAPWGLALAPQGFGRFANRLLIGNFGDGTINAYDIDTGHFAGRLRGTDRKPIRVEGLWGLAFGNGLGSQPVDTLFFTAGPDDENNGQYGRLDVAPGDMHDTSEDTE